MKGRSGKTQRTIGVVTCARSDFGHYLPLLQKLESHSAFRLKIFATGMHLSHRFGYTINSIHEHGFQIAERVRMNFDEYSPEAMVKSMGVGLMGFASLFRKVKPDLLLVLGDRYEMYTAALASVPFNILIAEI